MAQHRAGEFGEKALDEVQPGAVCGRESERETANRLFGKPSLRLFGNVGGMIVEDQFDRGMCRIATFRRKINVSDKAATILKKKSRRRLRQMHRLFFYNSSN